MKFKKILKNIIIEGKLGSRFYIPWHGKEIHHDLFALERRQNIVRYMFNGKNGMQPIQSKDIRIFGMSAVDSCVIHLNGIMYTLDLASNERVKLKHMAERSDRVDDDSELSYVLVKNVLGVSSFSSEILEYVTLSGKELYYIDVLRKFKKIVAQDYKNYRVHCHTKINRKYNLETKYE